MAAIATEVNRDAPGPGQLGEGSRGNGVRLVRFADLADRGDMVDVDGETHGERLARPRGVPALAGQRRNPRLTGCFGS